MSTVLNIDRLIFPHDLIVSVSDIYKWIGQNKFFKDTVKGDFDKIVDQTVERDAFFLSLILKLDLTDTRTRLIITKNSTPRNKEETTLFNIKETLTNFQLNNKNQRFQSNDILNQLNYIYSHEKDIKFAYTESLKRTMFVSQASESKRILLDEINDFLDLELQRNTYEKSILYLNYFVDFYNISPFTDHNDTAFYILLYLLILKLDLEAFKYISFFEILFENLGEFQLELKAASFNWKEGFGETIPFMRLIYRLIKQGYEKAYSVIKDYKYDVSLNKGDNIISTITSLPDIFSKDDIRLIHPYVSESTINRALIKLRDEGRIKPLSKGRSAKWTKIYKGYLHD